MTKERKNRIIRNRSLCLFALACCFAVTNAFAQGGPPAPAAPPAITPDPTAGADHAEAPDAGKPEATRSDEETSVSLGNLPSEAGDDVVRIMRPPEIEPSGRRAAVIKFSESPLDMVLDQYSRVTGKTMLLSPGLPTVSITLFSQQDDMSEEDFLLAMKTLLSMNGVALIPIGEEFVKVVPTKDLGPSGMPIRDGAEDVYNREDGRHVREVVQLTHIDINEAKSVIEGFKSPAGSVTLIERTNSIILLDTAANVNRMREILQYVDQPIVRREETNVRRILYAKASDIKKTIDEIVAQAKEAEGKNKPTTTVTTRKSGSPGVVRRTVPGVIRAPQKHRSTPANNPAISALLDDAARGIIRGEVQTLADERTNILIIITEPENMKFFNSIIDVLDVETEPDVLVEVFRLEYADAKEVNTMLNELIGSKSEDDQPKVTPKAGADGGKSATLREFVAKRAGSKGAEGLSAETKSSLGRLDSDSIKILADERSNALVVMASKADLATISEVINDMDIMLSQVMIETVILEVSLGDDLSAGVDWIQRSRVTYDGSEPLLSYAGSSGGEGTRPSPGLSFNSSGDFPASLGSGLNYYLTFFNLNVDMLISAATSDSDTQIHSTPVVMTQDNKEAEIKATRQIYVYKGKKYAGDAAGNPVYEDDVERQDVGITLTVTPRISPSGFVVMNIKQSIENISGQQIINESEWPVITKREFGADIAVQSGETIVLGGLVLNSKSKTSKGVPFLSKIPLLGWLFKSESYSTTRDEVVVFLTPYVMNSPEEIRAEAIRRGLSLNATGWTEDDWSNSSIKDDILRGREEGAESVLDSGVSIPKLED